MDQQVLKLAVSDLHFRKTELNEQLKKTEEAIIALQEVCKHVFEDDGHPSQHDVEICIYCGLQRSI